MSEWRAAYTKHSLRYMARAHPGARGHQELGHTRSGAGRARSRRVRRQLPRSFHCSFRYRCPTWECQAIIVNASSNCTTSSQALVTPQEVRAAHAVHNPTAVQA